MLEKSVSAMLSAIEIYNKPNFKYREETFSILCINSWELLFKAKVLNLANNKLASLYIVEYRTLKDGTKSSFPRAKKNRAGNPMSVGLMGAYDIITNEYGVIIDNAVKDNLVALTEIRDNSIHYLNESPQLATKVQELGSAALQNYLHIVDEWFGGILDGYNFYLMPISFFRDFNQASSILINKNMDNLLSYLKEIEGEHDESDEMGSYNLTLRVDIKFHKTKSDSSLPVRLTNDLMAADVRISEEDITEKYPWEYSVLTTRLQKRFCDFKVNMQYHSLRKKLELNEKFAYERLLNPRNPDGGKKILYNSNIIKEFDKHYTRR